MSKVATQVEKEGNKCGTKDFRNRIFAAAISTSTALLGIIKIVCA